MILITIVFMVELIVSLVLCATLLASILGGAMDQMDGCTRKLWNEARSGRQREARARAEGYLRRVLALTGAKRDGFSYVLDIGEARYRVRERYAGRFQRNGTRVICTETCFYLKQEMPGPERIATALLELKNNPDLFDSWVRQCGAYKPDGTLFTEPSSRSTAHERESQRSSLCTHTRQEAGRRQPPRIFSRPC